MEEDWEAGLILHSPVTIMPEGGEIICSLSRIKVQAPEPRCRNTDASMGGGSSFRSVELSELDEGAKGMTSLDGGPGNQAAGMSPVFHGRFALARGKRRAMKSCLHGEVQARSHEGPGVNSKGPLDNREGNSRGGVCQGDGASLD